ncbi:uncharacterized protein G2W53_032553 [Senna tora]|uniref:DUF7803 domain-containing protein n=1 Tax=Senna tora TaxID=362788 RepID=A0A834T0N6_9FABA|nr:uncharacterized protein G2W53_032553 [Senna tora]
MKVLRKRERSVVAASCHRRSRATVTVGGHRRSGLPVIEAAALPFTFSIFCTSFQVVGDFLSFSAEDLPESNHGCCYFDDLFWHQLEFFSPLCERDLDSWEQIDSQPTMEETILVGDDLMMGPPSPIVPPEIASHVLEGVDLCDGILSLKLTHNFWDSVLEAFFRNAILQQKMHLHSAECLHLHFLLQKMHSAAEKMHSAAEMHLHFCSRIAFGRMHFCKICFRVWSIYVLQYTFAQC